MGEARQYVKCIYKFGYATYQIRYNMIRPSLSKVRALHKHKRTVEVGEEREGQRDASPLRFAMLGQCLEVALKPVHAMYLLPSIVSFHC